MTFFVDEDVLLSSTPPRKRRLLDRGDSIRDQRTSPSPTSVRYLNVLDVMSDEASARGFQSHIKRPALPSMDENTNVRKRRFGRIVEIEFEHSLEALSVATSDFNGDDEEPWGTVQESKLDPVREVPVVVVTEASLSMSPAVSVCSYESGDAISISAFPQPPMLSSDIPWSDSTLDEVRAMSAFWSYSAGELEEDLFSQPNVPFIAVTEEENEALYSVEGDSHPEAAAITGGMSLPDCMCRNIDEDTLDARSPLVVLETSVKHRSAELLAVLFKESPLPYRPPQRDSCISISSVAPPPRTRKDLRAMLGSPYIAPGTIDDSKLEIASGGSTGHIVTDGVGDAPCPIEQVAPPPREAMKWTSYRPRQSLAPFAAYAVGLPPIGEAVASDTPPSLPPIPAVWSPLPSSVDDAATAALEEDDVSGQYSFMNHSPEIADRRDFGEDTRKATVRHLFKRAMDKTRMVNRWRKPKADMVTF
ncbi:hypothetical protein PUNSTDRAFT_142053 [Punctularia strigosozonata HHB-11173 SS5]|uniref:uncharacterized protein n=1 Tax=Punctularia strigosozonata (strain HHB-11173) TaxID=741275 RepID=UPI0004416962|nr:uncharacterized protein PUNSTDRAFT_142053 [Punctularia strigosozonata HHB-11173 SS5]EIN11805.1 hypothetical protein PUNSTDRAFT_142053 [Punctularia strigosozonata HHB-11173 SS5]